MTIHIEALTFKAIIGILDFERITPQNIIVDLLIDYDYSEDNFINYADVIVMIESLIVEKKYKLLEDALIDIEHNLLINYAQINKFKLKITKPDIINHAKVALSSEWERQKYKKML